MPALSMSMRPWRVLISVVIVALLVTAAVLCGRWFLSDTTCGSPPTQQVRSQQEGFVKAHLPDAGQFEWTVMDCDDNGQIVLNFTTRTTGKAANAAFLRDPACRPSNEPDASAGDVDCQTGAVEVFIFLEDKGAIDTEGQLTWTPN